MHVQIFVYPSYLIYFSFLYMYYLAVSEIEVFISTQSLFCFLNSTVRLKVCFVDFFSSFYRLVFGYDFPSTHHPHTQYSPRFTRDYISISGEESLPVRGFLLQHHNPAARVASLLLFLFFFTLNNYTNTQGLKILRSGDSAAFFLVCLQ